MTVVAPPAALEHYRARQTLLVALLLAFRREWARMGGDFDAAWAAIGPRLLLLMSAAQLQAAAEAQAYVWLAAQEQAIEITTWGKVNPRAFVGQASDGRPMGTLLRGAVVRSKNEVMRGATVPEALASGYRFLELVASTQVADAGRGAESVAIVATPQLTGYTRMLNPPSCNRCIILAGKWYQWNTGFLRHPGCDCLHVPSAAAASVANPGSVNPAAYFKTLSTAEQDATFGVASAQAIRDGADIFKVVNAERSTYTAAGQRAPTPGMRPTPEHIYAEADGDRVRAVQLLRDAGYLT